MVALKELVALLMETLEVKEEPAPFLIYHLRVEALAQALDKVLELIMVEQEALVEVEVQETQVQHQVVERVTHQVHRQVKEIMVVV